MNIIRLADYKGRIIREHGSTGAQVMHLVSASDISSVVRIRLEPESVLGVHEAVGDQLFLVIEGTGMVRSRESEFARVSEGDAVQWCAGELHETRSGPEGLTALVIEGPSLRDALLIK
jgi:quercetin dioxygenase-like cupin family protein